MGIERTELANQDFQGRVEAIPVDVNASRNAFLRTIVQSIIAENVYRPDTEWELWHRAQELEEQNGLPLGLTAYDLHQEYLRTYEGE